MTSRRLPLLAVPLALTALALSACTVEEGPAPAYPASNNEVVAAEPPPAPPPPPPEPVPASPGPEYGWVAGYHHWNGRSYDWVKGHYERRPRENARYQPAHWERRSNKQVFVEGRWE